MYAWGNGTLLFSKKTKLKYTKFIDLCGICMWYSSLFFCINWMLWNQFQDLNNLSLFPSYMVCWQKKNQITEIVLHASCRPEWQGFMSVVFLFFTEVSHVHLWLFGCNFWVMNLACQLCMPSQHSEYSKVECMGLTQKADSANTKHFRCCFFQFDIVVFEMVGFTQNWK